MRLKTSQTIVRNPFELGAPCLPLTCLALGRHMAPDDNNVVVQAMNMMGIATSSTRRKG